MVWVRPARFPANVMVAPNSPSALAQASTAPAAIDGHTMGRVIRLRTVRREAPSVAAASSYRRSALRSPASTVITRNGKAMKVTATITPDVEKGSRNPSCP